MKGLLVAGTLVTLLLAGCATHPVTDRQQMMLVSEQDVIASSYRTYAAQMSREQVRGLLNTDPVVLKRVRDVAFRLIPQAGQYRPSVYLWQWDVNVINSTELNAFCMAGGKIGVYSGLVTRLNLTDDELAQVVAHEIAHALSDHTREKVSLALATQAAVNAIVIVKDMPELSAAGLDALVEVSVRLPNSRELEREADRVGMLLAALAGYDPTAAARVWEKMRSAQGEAPTAFFATHPLPSERVAYLTEEANKFMAEYERKLPLRLADRLPKVDYRDGRVIYPVSRAKYEVPKNEK